MRTNITSWIERQLRLKRISQPQKQLMLMLAGAKTGEDLHIALRGTIASIKGHMDDGDYSAETVLFLSLIAERFTEQHLPVWEETHIMMAAEKCFTIAPNYIWREDRTQHHYATHASNTPATLSAWLEENPTDYGVLYAVAEHPKSTITVLEAALEGVKALFAEAEGAEDRVYAFDILHTLILRTDTSSELKTELLLTKQSENASDY